jgi:hypothetical protein
VQGAPYLRALLTGIFSSLPVVGERKKSEAALKNTFFREKNFLANYPIKTGRSEAELRVATTSAGL